jgi:hypothetical protein
MRDYVKKKDKVIFVGKGYDWWKSPVVIPEDTELWAINDVIMRRVEIDLLFNLHLLEDYAEVDMASVKMAGEIGIPIVMPQEYESISTSIRFPIEEVIAKYDTDYFVTGIAYMFAYAAYKGYKQIDCYGVNMRGADEQYKNARACVEYWIGVCKGQGITVNMHGKYCDCLKTFDRRLYGFNTFQTYPEDINDRALFVTFGASLDRTVMDKFHKFLSVQPDGKYFNNLRAIPLNDPRGSVMFDNLHVLVVTHGDATKFVGDIGFYNLLHVDKLINNEHSSKIICLEGDREKSIADWLNFSQDANLWTDPKSVHWNGDKSVEAGIYFPKYDLPKQQALERFYSNFYMIAKRCQYKYPGYFRHWKADMLDTDEGKKEILRFIGYKDEEMVLEIPDQPIPIKPPIAAQTQGNPEEGMTW